MTHLPSVLTALVALPAAVYGGACQPVNLIMTRASGSAAIFVDGQWSTAFGLSNINMASVGGALHYVMTEAIDKVTGYTNNTEDGCHRKHLVQ